MYNAELKSRFVKDYTKSINTANVPQQFSKRLNRMKLRGMQTSVQETEKNCSQLSMRYLHCAPEASGCLSRY